FGLHLSMRVGPHPHARSLGGPPSADYPPAPRSGRRRSINARGARRLRQGFGAQAPPRALGPQALACPRSWIKLARQFPVLDPVRLVGIGAEPALPVSLVVLVVPF